MTGIRRRTWLDGWIDARVLAWKWNAMKLRIRGSSLRLRLTRAEVARIGEGARVEETVRFGMGEEERLVYALVTSREAGELRARLTPKEIVVTLPADVASEWANGSAVGLAARQPIGAEGELEILVEKDFACLKPRSGEDDSDAFPNPTVGA